MQKRVKIYIKQESQVIKLLTEKGTSENHVCHLHEEKDKIKSNSPRKAMVVTSMHRGGVEAKLCLLFLGRTDDQAGYNGTISAKHIHLLLAGTRAFLGEGFQS